MNLLTKDNKGHEYLVRTADEECWRSNVKIKRQKLKQSLNEETTTNAKGGCVLGKVETK